jgi:hypothetical protein
VTPGSWVCDIAVPLGPHKNAVDRIARAEGAPKLDDNLIAMSLPNPGRDARPYAHGITYSEFGDRELKTYLPMTFDMAAGRTPTAHLEHCDVSSWHFSDLMVERADVCPSGAKRTSLESAPRTAFDPAEVIPAMSLQTIIRREAPDAGVFYETCFTPGGRHVPSPGGRIEGGMGFGQ